MKMILNDDLKLQIYSCFSKISVHLFGVMKKKYIFKSYAEHQFYYTGIL